MQNVVGLTLFAMAMAIWARHGDPVTYRLVIIIVCYIQAHCRDKTERETEAFRFII